jgi:flagellar motor switch/type III secretory pathway protein FliN
MLLPESAGILPGWYRRPDATGKNKLQTLARELAGLLLPEGLALDDFRAAFVDDLAAAVARGEVLDGAAIVPLRISSGQHEGTMSLLWPAAAPKQVLPKIADEATATPAGEASSEPTAGSFAMAARASLDADSTDGFERLPNYSRSLLKIKVPVVVTLAATRQPVGQIIELGPGMIIQFDKACDQMLDLEIGQQQVALGEAVKVGDKFGLRITSIILPGERFESLGGQKSATGQKRVM